jgi:hypothetical protein
MIMKTLLVTLTLTLLFAVNVLAAPTGLICPTTGPDYKTFGTWVASTGSLYPTPPQLMINASTTFAVGAGAPVLAANSGKIVFLTSSLTGFYVAVDSGTGYVMHYWDFDADPVLKVGNYLYRGQVIGTTRCVDKFKFTLATKQIQGWRIFASMYSSFYNPSLYFTCQ